MRRAARRDGNHAEVRDGCRACGLAVIDLGSMGDGVPDLLISSRNRMGLFEVKLPTERESLTKAQKQFHALWKGIPIEVVSTVEEVLEALK